MSDYAGSTDPFLIVSARMYSVGRKQSSTVHQFFSKDVDTYICTVICENGNACNFISKTLNGPSNLKEHLRRRHPSSFEAFKNSEREQSDKTDAKVTKRRVRSEDSLLNFVVVKKVKEFKDTERPLCQYNQQHYRQRHFNKLLSTFVAVSPLASAHMFTHQEYGFHKILSYVSDGKFRVPHHQTIYNNITKQAEFVESIIKLEITTVSHTTKDPVLPLCQASVDCWTRKGYKGSFYGETINFYNFDKNCVSQRTLAIDDFHHPHTGERIIEKFTSIHDSFGIKPIQIALVFSDNASNMLKAFKLLENKTDTITVIDNEFDMEVSDTDFDQLVHELSSIQTKIRHYGDPIHTKNLIMKLCSKPKFKSTCDLINNARALVNTVHKSATLKQEWDRVCSLSLVGDVPTRFDSTFLLTSRLAQVSETIPDFVIKQKISTNILPGTYHWSELEGFNRLMEPIYNSTLILSRDHFSISHLFPLMTMLLPRYLGNETTHQSSFPKLAKAMLEDLRKRFSWLYNNTYFQLLACLDPGYNIIFSKPPLSSQYNAMKELLATEYATWVSQSSLEVIEVTVRNPSPPAGIVDTCCNDWGSFFDEYDSDTQLQHTQQQLMPASKPLSSDSCPILIQFGEYCQENHTPATPTISVKHLKERGNQLHQYWRNKQRQWPELSTFALGHLAFSGAGIGVERLFSGAAIQADGRLHSLSNAALRERTLIATNREIVDNMDSSGYDVQ